MGGVGERAVWVVGAAGMHWRLLNTLITKELQASGGMGGESGGAVEAACVMSGKGVDAEGGVGGLGCMKTERERSKPSGKSTSIMERKTSKPSGAAGRRPTGGRRIYTDIP